MATLCSRIDCSEPAVAVFGFDATAALVWLDPYEEHDKGAGLLCEHHADTITPLRGWTLVDRRVPAPRLWAERPPGPAVPTPTSRSRRVRRACHSTTSPASIEPLPFDDAVPVLDRREHATPGAAHNQRDQLDELLDARSPLLARAFLAARPRGAVS